MPRGHSPHWVFFWWFSLEEGETWFSALGGLEAGDSAAGPGQLHLFPGPSAHGQHPQGHVGAHLANRMGLLRERAGSCGGKREGPRRKQAGISIWGPELCRQAALDPKYFKELQNNKHFIKPLVEE